MSNFDIEKLGFIPAQGVTASFISRSCALVAAERVVLVGDAPELKAELEGQGFKVEIVATIHDSPGVIFTDYEIEGQESILRLEHDLDEVAKTLDLTPAGIERTALNALYRGLCQLRVVSADRASVYQLSDAMHNLPKALAQKDFDLTRRYTVETVFAQREINAKQAAVAAGFGKAAC